MKARNLVPVSGDVSDKANLISRLVKEEIIAMSNRTVSVARGRVKKLVGREDASLGDFDRLAHAILSDLEEWES